MAVRKTVVTETNEQQLGQVIEKAQAAISAPNMKFARLNLRGIAPLVVHRFGQKAMLQMREKQAAGSTGEKRRKIREAKDFDALYEQAKHVSTEGWEGVHAACFRNAAISACRLVGFKMTLAKLAIFTEADGFDKVDASPLVRIYGKSKPIELPVRNDSGVVDIRVRPMYFPWEAEVRMRFDGDIFTLEDIVNLMARIGAQVGIGEGRPDSKESAGVGWGLFEVINESERRIAA